MDITHVNHLQELFGPKPVNMIQGGQIPSLPIFTNRELKIGAICLGAGIIIGCIIYHHYKDDK